MVNSVPLFYFWIETGMLVSMSYSHRFSVACNPPCNATLQRNGQAAQSAHVEIG